MFALTMIVFGGLYAFFALAQELTYNGKVFWIHTPRFHGLGDLWELRKPQPLRRPDGDASADSIGARLRPYI